MNCPLCSKPISAYKNIFVCPDGHGELVTGGFISGLKDSATDQKISETPDAYDTSTRLICPNCSNPMEKVNYNNTGIMIDSCTTCPYRWLDSGEAQKIAQHQPDFSPEDLINITDFNAKLKELDVAPGTDNNPKLPFPNAVRIVAAGDSRRTLGALSGMALFGTVSGMIKSRFLRYLLPLLIVFFAAALYLIIKSYSS